MITLGVNTVLLGRETLRTAMQHIKWMGYDAAEISALQGCGAFGDPLGEHLHLDRWKNEVDEIRSLVVVYVSCCSNCTSKSCSGLLSTSARKGSRLQRPGRGTVE